MREMIKLQKLEQIYRSNLQSVKDRLLPRFVLILLKGRMCTKMYLRLWLSLRWLESKFILFSGMFFRSSVITSVNKQTMCDHSSEQFFSKY